MCNKSASYLPFSLPPIAKKCLFYIGLMMSLATSATCEAKALSHLLGVVTCLLAVTSRATFPPEKVATTCDISALSTPFHEWYESDSVMATQTVTMPDDPLRDYYELTQTVEALKLRLLAQEKNFTQQMATCEERYNSLLQRINELEVSQWSDQLSLTMGAFFVLFLLFACYKAHEASMDVVKDADKRGNKINLRAISPVFHEQKFTPRSTTKRLAPPSTGLYVKELRTSSLNETGNRLSILNDMRNYDPDDLDRLHMSNTTYACEQKEEEEEESKEEKHANPLYNVD